MSLVRFNESNIKTRFIKNLLEHSYVPSVNTISNFERSKYNSIDYQEVQVNNKTGWSSYTISSSSSSPNIQIGTTNRYYAISTTRLVYASQDLVNAGTPGFKLDGIKKIGVKAQDGYKYSITGYNDDISVVIYFNSLSDNDTEYQVFDVSNCAYINILLAKTNNATITLDDYDKIIITSVYEPYANNGNSDIVVQLNADYFYKDSIINIASPGFDSVIGSFQNIRDDIENIDVIRSVDYNKFITWVISHSIKPTKEQWRRGIKFNYRCNTVGDMGVEPYLISWYDTKGKLCIYKITSYTELQEAGIVENDISNLSYAIITSSCNMWYQIGGSFPKDYKYSTISKINYDINTYIPQYTRYFKNKYNYYDSETHAYLGNYLRTLRDVYNLDLMSLYNVFNEQYITDIELKLDDNYKVVFNEQDTDTYKVYAVPIKYNKPYTISLQCTSNVLISPILYDNRALVKNIPETQENKYYTEFLKYDSSINVGGMTFNKPYVFQGVSSEMSDEGIRIFGDANFLYNQERNLYLLIQVPKNNKSSFVVIEGEYNFGRCRKVISLGDIKEKTDLSDYYVNTTYVSKPDLLSVNDGNNYAFSDRLIEYLTLNTIDNNDKIEFNVLNVQRKLGLPETTIWNDEMRINLYNRLLSLGEDKRRQINIDNKDILGYVDKDIERYLNSVLFNLNFDDLTKTDEEES